MSDNHTDPLDDYPENLANSADVSSRVDKVMHDQELMALEQAEADTQRQKKRQRAELSDHRTKLLKAVKVEAPDLAVPLFEKLSALADENHGFAPREVVDLLKSHKARFKDEPDFFDLGIAQREDLLDRVGFYRGVVIDNTMSNPVEAGFRDVLMRPDAGSDHAGAAQQSLHPATLFYRKPNFSGYFENYYTSSESVYQTQKNGVTNLSFALGLAAGGLRNSVSLGASFSKYGRQEESSSFIGKTVFTTANFYLPKIELSFDKTQSCASQAFFKACSQAVAGLKETDLNSSNQSETEQQSRTRWDDSFRKLKDVLDDFGHFVPLQTLIGGRLFATEKKTFEGSEKSSDFTDRFGVSVKASLSTLYAEAEISGGYENSKQASTKSRSSSEMQSMTFNAIGGEGTVVQDAAAWAESLYDYRRWACVQRENLVPSINFLPVALRQLCWRVLSKMAEDRTKRDLLYIHKAFFLFYGEYGERIGRTARDVYFSIQSHAYNAAVATKTTPPSEEVEAVLVEPDTLSSQLWRMTESGQIVLRATGRKSAHGEINHISFALTADLPAEEKTALLDTYPVKLCQLSNDASQIWNYPGSGELTCQALGKDYVLEAVSTSALCLKKRKMAGRESHLWYLAEVPFDVEKALDDVCHDQWVQIFTQKGNAVLSVANVETLDEINATDITEVIAQPNMRGRHQFWLHESSGRLVSAMKVRNNDQLQPLLLSADDISGRITASVSRSDLIQKWSTTTTGELQPATSASVRKALGCFSDGGKSTIGCTLLLRESNAQSDQKWQIRAYNKLPVFARKEKKYSNNNLQEECLIFWVDKPPLVIKGQMTGLVFFLEGIEGSGDNKKCALRMTVFCQNESGREAVSHKRGDNKNLEPLLREERHTFIDNNYLHLPAPDYPIYSLRMNVANSQGDMRSLRFEYQSEQGGTWQYFSNPGTLKESSLLKTSKMKVALQYETSVAQGEFIIAVGIDARYDANRMLSIAPKILAKSFD
ncbi:hypothetical protein EHW64_04360 [Erwinia psidii]|uniref:MAC/perforin domain-containing protein n=1 Tax=Erwinia psidii TaxID=69224 RepID=UPI00226B57BD|nr:MAC/perforin domain-containing protein [Erwinia psidii]MCX8960426.1 hypothetical protein [Erwinia psidii]